MKKLDLHDGRIDDCLTQRDNFEAIFNSMNEGLFIVNHQNNITQCNRAFLKITGLKEKEVLNQSVVGVCCRKPTCGLAIAVSKTLQTGQFCEEEAMELIRKDGTRVPAVFSSSVLRNRNGDATGIVILVRDVSLITELRKKLEDQYRFHNLIGKNHRMQEIYKLVTEVAESDATVLIQGESGTGKELVAHAIHHESPRSHGPFVTVSCAALVETLLESELFGHVKGAFTGAHRDKPGRFELADKGTIFLDEIAEVGPAVQVKLLRVLQERQVERVGDSKPIKTDVRIIAATNRDLKQLVRENRFRHDLFYRLNVVFLELPPLRQRRDDIPILVDHFIKKFNVTYKKRVNGVCHEALDILMEHDWEGNVRELENAIEHAFVKARARVLLPEDFPHEIRQGRCLHVGGKDSDVAPGLDKDSLIKALTETGWNQSKAARKLGVNRVTVWRNIKRYHIEVPTE